MTRVFRGLLFGAVAGVVLGVAARALMRLVALGMEHETEFNPGVSLVVVALFAIAGAGAGLAGATRLRTWKLAALLAPTSGPLLLMGTGFSLGEIGEIYDLGLSPARTIALTAVALLIVGLVLVTPYAGHRAGRTRERARLRSR